MKKLQLPSRERLVRGGRLLAYAGLGAAGAGAAWAGWEARLLILAGVPWLEAVCAVAASALLVTLVCMVPGAIAGWLWLDRRFGGALRVYLDKGGAQSASRVVSFCLALFGLGYAVFFALELFTASFASVHVRAIAIGGVTPVMALAALGIYELSSRALGRVVERLSWRRVYATALYAGLVLAALGWAASFFALAPTVYEELEPLRFVPFVMSGAAALLGSVWLRGRFSMAAVPVFAALALLGGAHFVGESSNQLNQYVEQQTHATRLVLGYVDRLPSVLSPSNRRGIEGTATCVPGVVPPAAESIGQAAEGAPHIVLVTVDAMRWDRTSLSGYERQTTPHLLHHAGQAAVFENAYTPATSTRQSFRSLFSGIHPGLVAAPKGTRWGVSFAPGQETLASYLSAAGYRTVAVVSDLKAFPREHRALTGFEVIDDSAEAFHKQHRYSAPYKIDRLITHLNEPGDDRPVFVWTHLREPHQPFLRGPDPVEYGKSPSERYDSALHFVDGELDRLLRFVQSPHWRQNTYLFLSADHGHAFHEHGHRAHGSTAHQEQSRVPLLVWGPAVEPGLHQAPITLLDVMPTLLDLAGLKPIEALCGKSLMPTLRGVQSPQRPVYVEQLPDATRDYFSIGYVRESYALIYNPPKGVVELYDMDRDPAQKNNLAEERPERVVAFFEELRAFHRRHGFDSTLYGLDGL